MRAEDLGNAAAVLGAVAAVISLLTWAPSPTVAFVWFLVSFVLVGTAIGCVIVMVRRDRQFARRRPTIPPPRRLSSRHRR